MLKSSRPDSVPKMTKEQILFWNSFLVRLRTFQHSFICNITLPVFFKLFILTLFSILVDPAHYKLLHTRRPSVQQFFFFASAVK